jgi:N-acetylmuramoyl-L-alanine amidase
MFVSIHSNANVKPQDGGTETYYHPEKSGSKVLAQLVQSELVKELGLLNRQVKASSGLVVTRETIMPSILVETAFLSNPVEEQLLADPAFRERAASAVWRGIQDFFWQLLDDPSLARPYHLGQNAPQPATSAPTPPASTAPPSPGPAASPTASSTP